MSTTAASIPVTQTTTPRFSEQLRDSAAFGAMFSDHVLVADYADGKWGDASIVPYGPMLLPAAPAVPRSPQYRRRTLKLPQDAWSRLDERARALNVTKAAVLLTIYAQTLARWAEEPRFSVMLTLYDRSELPPDAARTVGDFTSLMLLELELPAASFADRVRYALPGTLAYTARRAARVGRRLLSERRLRASSTPPGSGGSTRR